MGKWTEDQDALRQSLRDAHIGQWAVELDEGEEARLYADDTFFDMMGMSSTLTPEEGYRFWESHVEERDKERAGDYMKEMIETGHSEIKYAWQHPDGRELYIRCEGRRDPNYTTGVRLRGSHQDITEIVMMQRELLNREQDYQQLNRTSKNQENILNTIPGGVGVVRYGENGVWTPEFLSEGFAAMTGMSMEEAWNLYRKDAMSGVHPDDVPKLSKELEEFLSGDQEYVELMYRLKKGDGSYFWVKNSMTTTVDEKGEKRTYCVYRDMTKELEEQNALREQYQERLSQHYRAAGPEILMVGHCNLRTGKMVEIIDYTGSSLPEQLGDDRDGFYRGFSEMMEEKDRDPFLAVFQTSSILKAYQEGTTEVTYTSFLKFPNDAHGRYAQIKSSIMTEPDTGEETGILTVTDVTEQTMIRKIVQNLSVLGCDFISDVDVYSDTQTVFSLSGMQPYPGGRNSFSGSVEYTLRHYVEEKDRQLVRGLLEPDTILEKLKKDRAYSFTYHMRNKEGQNLTKKLTVSAVDLRLGRICLARVDITKELEEEHSVQAALEEALEDSKKASKAKSEFLSSMSHDIRTPMNAILGMTEIAFHHLDQPELLKQNLKDILLSGKHLLGLINNVLDMSKIEQGKLAMSHERIYLPTLLDEIYAMFASQAEQKNIRFLVNKKNLSCVDFYGDPLRMKQVLINLLGNAFKFTGEQGCVTLLAEEVGKQDQKNTVRYRFLVQDTGKGIAKDTLKHLFDPFVRGKDTQSVEGSGLGLSITKGIVDQMGGTIDVESREGKGSIFRVELEFPAVPHQKCEEEGEFSSGRYEHSVAGYHFLAAEDNHLNAEILEELMKMKGASVYTVTNGAQAAAEFRSTPPGTYDAVLLDIQMPVMNGYDAAKAIRKMDRPDARTIPIVAMTANAFAEDVRQAMEAGMDAHIAKPLDIERTERILDDLIRQNRKRKNPE